MIPHIVVFLVALPLQLLLGFWNSKSKLLDGGEVGFWGVIIFLVADMIYLGAIR